MTTTMARPINQMMDAIDAVRKVDPEMPVQTLLALLWIHENQGGRMTDLRDHLAVSPSAAVRIVARLSGNEEARRIYPYQCVTVETDPTDARQRQLYLLPKGVEWVKSILKSISN